MVGRHSMNWRKWRLIAETNASVYKRSISRKLHVDGLNIFPIENFVRTVSWEEIVWNTGFWDSLRSICRLPTYRSVLQCSSKLFAPLRIWFLHERTFLICLEGAVIGIYESEDTRYAIMHGFIPFLRFRGKEEVVLWQERLEISHMANGIASTETVRRVHLVSWLNTFASYSDTRYISRILAPLPGLSFHALKILSPFSG